MTKEELINKFIKERAVHISDIRDWKYIIKQDTKDDYFSDLYKVLGFDSLDKYLNDRDFPNKGGFKVSSICNFLESDFVSKYLSKKYKIEDPINEIYRENNSWFLWDENDQVQKDFGWHVDLLEEAYLYYYDDKIDEEILEVTEGSVRHTEYGITVVPKGLKMRVKLEK